MSQRLGGLLSRVLDRLLMNLSPVLPGVVRRVCPAAKRFKKQIFLSVDIPPEVYSSGQGSAVLLEVEKGLVGQLRDL